METYKREEILKMDNLYGFVHLEDGDSFNPNCGYDFTEITEEDIEALSHGKALYMDDGEYAHIFIKR